MVDTYDEHAPKQVDAFLNELQNRYGLSTSDVTNLLQFALRLQRGQRTGERMGEWTAKAFIAAFAASFVAGLLGLIWFAFVHIIDMIANGRH